LRYALLLVLLPVLVGSVTRLPPRLVYSWITPVIGLVRRAHFTPRAHGWLLHSRLWFGLRTRFAQLLPLHYWIGFHAAVGLRLFFCATGYLHFGPRLPVLHPFVCATYVTLPVPGAVCFTLPRLVTRLRLRYITPLQLLLQLLRSLCTGSVVTFCVCLPAFTVVCSFVTVTRLRYVYVALVTRSLRLRVTAHTFLRLRCRSAVSRFVVTFYFGWFTLPHAVGSDFAFTFVRVARLPHPVGLHVFRLLHAHRLRLRFNGLPFTFRTVYAPRLFHSYVLDYVLVHAVTAVTVCSFGYPVTFFRFVAFALHGYVSFCVCTFVLRCVRLVYVRGYATFVCTRLHTGFTFGLLRTRYRTPHRYTGLDAPRFVLRFTVCVTVYVDGLRTVPRGLRLRSRAPPVALRLVHTWLLRALVGLHCALPTRTARTARYHAPLHRVVFAAVCPFAWFGSLRFRFARFSFAQFTHFTHGSRTVLVARLFWFTDSLFGLHRLHYRSSPHLRLPRRTLRGLQLHCTLPRTFVHTHTFAWLLVGSFTTCTPLRCSGTRLHVLRYVTFFFVSTFTGYTFLVAAFVHSLVTLFVHGWLYVTFRLVPFVPGSFRFAHAGLHTTVWVRSDPHCIPWTLFIYLLLLFIIYYYGPPNLLYRLHRLRAFCRLPVAVTGHFAHHTVRLRLRLRTISRFGSRTFGLRSRTRSLFTRFWFTCIATPPFATLRYSFSLHCVRSVTHTAHSSRTFVCAYVGYSAVYTRSPFGSTTHTLVRSTFAARFVRCAWFGSPFAHSSHVTFTFVCLRSRLRGWLPRFARLHCCTAARLQLLHLLQLHTTAVHAATPPVATFHRAPLPLLPLQFRIAGYVGYRFQLVATTTTFQFDSTQLPQFSGLPTQLQLVLQLVLVSSYHLLIWFCVLRLQFCTRLHCRLLVYLPRCLCYLLRFAVPGCSSHPVFAPLARGCVLVCAVTDLPRTVAVLRSAAHGYAHCWLFVQCVWFAVGYGLPFLRLPTPVGCWFALFSLDRCILRSAGWVPARFWFVYHRVWYLPHAAV